MDLQRIMAECGGVASRAKLTRAGVGRRPLEHELAAGNVLRLRSGWYSIPTAPPNVVRAVRVGGRLSCTSALSAMGVWTMPDDTLHVRVARGTSVRPEAGVRLHWRDERMGMSFPMDDPATSLSLAIGCLDRRAAIAALDSVVNTRVLSLDKVVAICNASPRGRQLLRHIDPASQSGLETLARLALRACGLRVRTQVEIAGVGFVDLVIGDRLVLELDGEAWHDRPGDFEADRRRDRALVALGYIVIRASYRQVMTEWPAIQAQILSITRRNEHRWRVMHPGRP